MRGRAVGCQRCKCPPREHRLTRVAASRSSATTPQRRTRTLTIVNEERDRHPRVNALGLYCGY
jgi:hypothetical protein